jgi:uroporphyrinogen-III decarboxylase
MLPFALGQRLVFHEGEGPVLERIEDSAGIEKLAPGRIASSLAPVFSSIYVSLCRRSSR